MTYIHLHLHLIQLVSAEDCAKERRLIGGRCVGHCRSEADQICVHSTWSPSTCSRSQHRCEPLSSGTRDTYSEDCSGDRPLFGIQRTFAFSHFSNIGIFSMRRFSITGYFSGCHCKLINNTHSHVTALRELCISQLSPSMSLQELLALIVLIVMRLTSRQVFGRTWQYFSEGCWLAASLMAFSSTSPTSLTFWSWQTHRKGFMEPHNDMRWMCSTGVIVNGGSCVDSLGWWKISGTSFWFASMNINGSFPGHG